MFVLNCLLCLFLYPLSIAENKGYCGSVCVCVCVCVRVCSVCACVCTSNRVRCAVQSGPSREDGVVDLLGGLRQAADLLQRAAVTL
uniref:Secreted protein n=1 Tax=Anguilla anguilla TaxID=7936 RepID=A0A0E9W2E2_ANGAN